MKMASNASPVQCSVDCRETNVLFQLVHHFKNPNCVFVAAVLLSCVVVSAVTPPSRLKKKHAPVMTSRGDGWWWGLTDSVKKRNGDARRV